jgi:hypothetical protein
VAVLTADVILSSHYTPAARRELNASLRRSFRQVERVHDQAIFAPLTFRITAGDEFQCVFSRIESVFDAVTLLRALVATSGIRPLPVFRASIGVGEMTIVNRRDPYEADGPAFSLARTGLEEIQRARSPERWTRLATGVPERDAAVNTVLCLADGLMAAWTASQWQAIRWTLAGFKRQKIARRLAIAHQNVSKRLQAADWPRFQIAAAFVGDVLLRAAHPPEGANNLRTPLRVQA